MHLYNWLSKIPFLSKSYSNKFLFVAFLGIHIPLIGLIFTIVFSQQQFSNWTIIIFTLLLTLVASLTTLIVIHKLIKPIVLASKSLVNYRQNRTVPKLPMNYSDESGILMSNIQSTINENELYLKQKQDLIYLLTHDIKNFASQPLVIADFILEDTATSQRNRDYAQLIKESSRQQLTFLDGFTKLLNEENQIATAEITKETVSITALTNAIQDELSVKLSEKNITLIVHSEIKQVVIYSKELLLTRIISNLVSNAIKFSKRNGEIKLSVAQSDGYLTIQVEDQGIGFDISKKQHLFDRFTSMGRMGTNNEISTGIGLYLSKEMAKKLNDTIEAFSEGNDKGAIFTLSLKLA
ncbi:sensor histidine kinase [Flavobacterium tegetincola]|uniref:sensor histidine kinase n=1 Tax=Flavobacterium tegetincola TaxID=150172 RepID=UPI0004797BF2|nr:HAMP domain-containing sensor histidine kinase [Flavobacterium tegetincola]